MSSSWSQVAKKNSPPLKAKGTKEVSKDTHKSDKIIKNDLTSEEEHSLFWTRTHVEEIAYEILDYCRHYAPTLLQYSTSSELSDLLLDFIVSPNPFRIEEDRGNDEMQADDDFY